MAWNKKSLMSDKEREFSSTRKNFTYAKESKEEEEEDDKELSYAKSFREKETREERERERV